MSNHLTRVVRGEKLPGDHNVCNRSQILSWWRPRQNRWAATLRQKKVIVIQYASVVYSLKTNQNLKKTSPYISYRCNPSLLSFLGGLIL